MERDVIDVKMESIRRCVARIVSKQPFNLERLINDYDLQDVVSVNLERAVQNSVDIAALLLANTDTSSLAVTMADSFVALQRLGVIDASLRDRMKSAVGFRNILVHEYTSIDWGIVHDLSSHHLQDFKEFVRSVDVWLNVLPHHGPGQI
jgi:uncharacterized protein YutE (UPF0331/DUF86 family)